MRIVHILHHSVSPFTGQFPDEDARHYNSGFPMQFARATRARYPDVELECWRPECSLRVPYTWYDEVYRIKHRVFPSLFLRYGWELSLPLLKAVKNLVRSDRSCFFVHGSYNLHTYTLATILKDAPTILQSHGGLPALARMRLSRRQWLRAFYLSLVSIEKRTLPQYPHIFAVNMQEKHNLEEAFPEVSVSFSPVGVDFDLFSPGDKQVSRKHLGLDPEAKIVLFVGRLATEKGIDYLLEASVELTARFSQFRLYIVGTGPEEQALKQRASSLGIQEGVHFVGYVPHETLAVWYRAADVTCLPSLFEGFPMVAAEAMACGAPVVMTRAGGTEDVVCAFECGKLAPPRDPQSLVQALSGILSNSCNTIPDIGRARAILDWSVKLEHSFEIFHRKAE